MEKIYNLPKTTEIVNIKEKFIAFKEALKIKDNKIFPETDDEIRSALNFNGTDDDFKDLLQSVDLDEHLAQNDDVRVLPFTPSGVQSNRPPVVEIPKKALRLSTFRSVVELKEKKIPIASSLFKYKQLTVDYSSDKRDLKPYEDVLISIRFYCPFMYTDRQRRHGPKFSKEFLVHGQQYLTELRDQVNCICNNKPFSDISEDPYQTVPNLATNPGFFFITDTFYNDTRNPNNPDYSAVIRKWAEDKQEQFTTKFKVKKMENTKFLDLSVRLGYPQVYQHFGNCEHIFVFSYIQLLSPKSHLLSADYPIVNTVAFQKAIMCNICAAREYSYLVKNCNRHLYDPVYLCQMCFISYHYINGEKVGEFEAYLLNPSVVQEEEVDGEELCEVFEVDDSE